MYKIKIYLTNSFLFLVCILLSSCSKNIDAIDEFSHIPADELYNMGVAKAKQQKYSESRKYFESLEANYPLNKNIANAKIYNIYNTISLNEFDMTDVKAEHFLQLYPDHEHIDYVKYIKNISLYRKILPYKFPRYYFPSNMAAKDIQVVEKLFTTFKNFLTEYPDSNYVSDSYKRAILLRNKIAEHNLIIADYYYKENLNIAASKRALFILENFNDTKHAKYAENIYKKSMEKLKFQK